MLPTTTDVVVGIALIVPNRFQGEVVRYDSNDSSGTYRAAFSIGVLLKSCLFIAEGISHVIILREEQLLKQKFPKFVTEFGMEIEIKLLQ